MRFLKRYREWLLALVVFVLAFIITWCGLGEPMINDQFPMR